MRRTAAVSLYALAILVSVRAWQELSDEVSLGGNALAQYHHVPLVWHLRWVFLGIFISSAFVVAARGRWRFAAALPLAICALVAFGFFAVWLHASA